MFFRRFSKQSPGRVISAESLNRPRGALERFLGLHVAAPLQLQWFNGQPMLWLDSAASPLGFAYTPSGGIPVATVTGSPPQYTAGHADCTPYTADDTGTITADPGTATITLYNASTSGAVAGLKLVIYAYINDLPYVVMEPC